VICLRVSYASYHHLTFLRRSHCHLRTNTKAGTHLQERAIVAAASAIFAKRSYDRTSLQGIHDIMALSLPHHILNETDREAYRPSKHEEYNDHRETGMHPFFSCYLHRSSGIFRWSLTNSIKPLGTRGVFRHDSKSIQTNVPIQDAHLWILFLALLGIDSCHFSPS